ncbi:adenosylcobinamide kinase [Archaeoglobales archaeon]|nr:MAG: adenosylcobinamide kinase [Archaeoglobales archaeon]
MRYYLKDEALIIEGEFEAVSSGLQGGWKKINYIFNHTVNDFDLEEPVDYLRKIAEKYGLKEYFGLLTSVPMDKLSIEKIDDVTVFVTAGVKNPNEKIGTINIIIVIDAVVSGGGMINAVITATEAKTKALIELGHNFTGTNTDAVIVAMTSKGRYYEYAGPMSELGRKIWIGVNKAVKESLLKWD